LGRICILILLIAFAFTNKTLATSFDGLSANISEDYLKWLESEDKESVPMPRMYEVMENYQSTEIRSEKIKDSLFGARDNILGTNSVENIRRYFLGDEIALRVKNQKNTTECWAFSIISSLESNMAKLRGIENINFSERHMDYATSRTFLNNQINEKGFYRELAAGGTPDIALAYLTSGIGPVNEEVMPFKDSEEKINLSELVFPEPETKVNGYVSFKSILKEQKNGKTYCYDKSGNVLTNQEVTQIRNQIKKHIMNYGAIAAFTAGAQYEYYSNPSNFFQSEAYYCDNLDVRYDHAITIVGWDDNYSKDNFNPNHRPTSDGAYIVLNSYGKESFDNGYIYISYEDAYIEYYLYGITSTEDVTYDNMYQYDPYGCVSAIGSTSYSSGYGANVFTRENSNEEEYLNEVSFNLVAKSSVEVYVNPNGADFNNLIKVCDIKKDLAPGYHTVNFEPLKLTGDKFVVVVKYINAGEGFYFGVECKINGSVYQNVSAESGQSYLSFDGNSWEDITNLSIRGLDMKSANICIKAFTEERAIQIPDEPVEVPDEPEKEPEIEDVPEPEIPEVPEEPEIPQEPETKPEEDGKEPEEDGEIIIESENKNENTNEKNESTVVITVTNKENTEDSNDKNEPEKPGKEEIPEEKPEEEVKPEQTPEEDNKPQEEEKEEETKPEDNTEEKNQATIIIEVSNEKVESDEENNTSDKEDTKEEINEQNSANVIVTVGNGKNLFSNWYNLLNNSNEKNIAQDIGNKIYKTNNIFEIFFELFKF